MQNQQTTKTPVCSTSFISHSLDHFSMEEVLEWFAELRPIDKLITKIIDERMEDFNKNERKITPELEELFTKIIQDNGIECGYNLQNIDAFHGYTVYAFPDHGKIRDLCGNPDIYYGLAKATSYGVAHRHFESPAFNRVLYGEGIFCGDDADKGRFKNHYHRLKLFPGNELEIETNMVHGHLVSKKTLAENEGMWFFFVQECGFNKDLKCAGDFNVVPKYNASDFGDEYV